MNKLIVFLIFLVANVMSARPALAEFSENTAQVPSSATITATVVDGNGVVTWTDPLRVTRVQHYIGHGKKGGTINDITVGAEKQVVLGDLAKNGGRFNVVVENGQFLHLECGGNDTTVEPKLVGLRKDCSYADPDSGQLVGALVVE